MSDEHPKDPVKHVSKVLTELNALASADDAAEEAAETVEQTEEKREQLCPRCKWPVDQRLVRPATEDMQEYVRSVLGNKPFRKVYELYNKALQVELVSLTEDETKRLSLILAEYRNVLRDMSEEALASGGGGSMEEALSVRVLFYVRKLGTQTWPCATASTLEEAREEFQLRFGKTGETVLPMLIRLALQFTRLLESLVESGFDESFYRGAGLG